jgi:hypothetical protein
MIIIDWPTAHMDLFEQKPLTSSLYTNSKCDYIKLRTMVGKNKNSNGKPSMHEICGS